MESTCPHCKKKKVAHYKSWEMTGRGHVTVTIHIFNCPRCGKYWREYY